MRGAANQKRESLRSPLPQQHGENLVGASAHGAGIEAYAGGAVREVNLADGRNAAPILRDNLCVLRLTGQLLHLAAGCRHFFSVLDRKSVV